MLLTLVVLLELIAPFVSTTYGVDAGYHVRWIAEFATLLSHGDYVPRWVSTAYSGFGAPSFYFYPPLTYYVAYALRLLTGVIDPKTLFNLTGLLATIGSFFSVRMLFNSLGAEVYRKNVAALLYAFAPLRIAEMYSRSNLSVDLGYVFLPLVWLGVVLLFRTAPSRRHRGVFTLAISASLLAITNLPLFLTTTTCLIVGAIVCHKQLTRRVILNAGLASLLVIGLTAFHYFTVLSFMDDSRLSGLLVLHPDYLVTDLLHGHNTPAAYHIFLILIGFALIGLAARSRLRLNRSIDPTQRAILGIGLACAAFVAFLGIPIISVPVWRFLPPLPLIQDSWRFYSCGLLFVVTLLAIADWPSMRKAYLAIGWLWTLGAIVPIVLVVFHLHFYKHFERSPDVATEYLTTSGVSRYSIVETMARHKNDAAALATLSPNESVVLWDKYPTFERFNFILDSSREVTFHRFYWPAWHLYVNGTAITTRPDSLGRAVASMPAGDYVATWRLEASPLERAGMGISEISFVGIFAVGGVEFFRSRRRGKKVID